MRLEELGGPGTEYAIREHDYNAPARARLVGIETRQSGGEALVSKTRRFARMIVVEGAFRAGEAPEKGVLVQGRHVLMPWPEFEEKRAERERRRAEREDKSERAAWREADFRRRCAALGITEAAEEEGIERLNPQSRWGLSHMLVADEVLFGLLEHAEAASYAAAGDRDEEER